MSSKDEAMAVAAGAGCGLILIILLFIVAGPLALIWAVNTLFSNPISYTFINWFAALVILCLVRGSSNSGSSKS